MPRHYYGGEGGTLPWGSGWRPGARGVDDADRVACVDHPTPGCPVEQCVTACWTCNSSLKNKPRPVLPGRTLTARDRAMGRKLWQVYCDQRKRALTGQPLQAGGGGADSQAQVGAETVHERRGEWTPEI